MRTWLVLSLLVSTLSFGCGKKEPAPAAGGGGAAAAAPADGPNPFKIQKETVEAFMASVEKTGAADKAALLASAQKFVDDKKADIKANCALVLEYRQDPKKSELAEGQAMDFEALSARLLKAAANDMNTYAKLSNVLESFRMCERGAKL